MDQPGEHACPRSEVSALTQFVCCAGEGKKGWVLLRASLHDPLLVLNAESDLPGGAAKLAGQASPAPAVWSALLATL